MRGRVAQQNLEEPIDLGLVPQEVGRQGLPLLAHADGQQLAASDVFAMAERLGVSLLLWHELTNLSGRPVGVLLALTAAVAWALGTQQLRQSTLPAAALTISFWMTVLTTLVMSALSVTFEMPQWKAPSTVVWLTILYNAVLIFGFAHAAWTFLARSLPPVASSLSVMMIPILGVFAGAIGLGEVLHWQDWAAVVLMVVAIGSVLVPSRLKTDKTVQAD